MAGKTLSITYVSDAQAVLRNLGQMDAAHGKFGAGVQKAGSSFGQVFGTNIPLGAVAAGAAIVKFGKDAIMAAADLGEQTSRAQVQFGDASDAVLAFGKTSASSFGIANAEALEAASGFGSMAQSAGLSEAASADMSVELVKLAADMASFNNQDPSEMLEKLRSGLAGEAEPLRQFGVFISEAAVQTEAYASGIAVAGAELTDAEKIQARYNLIFAQTVKQQGDFARTADSLPNQLRGMRAEWTDLSAELGGKFLPIIVEVAQAFRAIMPLLGIAADHIGEIVVVLVAFAAAKFVPALLFQIALGLEAVGAAGIASALGGLAATLSAIAAPAVALGAAAFFGAKGVASLIENLTGLSDDAHTTAEFTQQLADAWDTGKLSVEDLRAAVADYNEDVVGMGGFTRITTGDVRALSQGSDDLAGSVEGATGAEEGLTAASEDATAALRDQKAATLDLAGGFLGLIGTADQLQEAQKEVNALQRHGKEGTEEYRDAVLAGLEAQLSLEQGLKDYAQELKDSGATQQDVMRKVRDLAREFGLQGSDVRDLLADVREYIRGLLDIPSSVHTNITSSTSAQQAQFGFHGVVSSPTLFSVAEAGPERVDIGPVAGGGIGGRGGGGTMIVNINVGTLLGSSSGELARIVRDELVKLQRRNVTTSIV